ncbi:hypothetical protein PSYPI_46025, partial [Pseudomonas syringae pv. pisi str. 1704B]
MLVHYTVRASRVKKKDNFLCKTLDIRKPPILKWGEL